MHLFYTPDIEADLYQLNEEESRHAIKVLRLSLGDVVQLVDGRGGFYDAQIIEDHPKRCLLKVVSKKEAYGKRNHYLHIAIAPTKNIERIEWFLEKATEMGIDEITPIICDRSERKDVKVSRLEKIITSAVKQSLKAYHPKLNAPQSFKDFIQYADSHYYIAHCMEGSKELLNSLVSPGGSYTIMIGPEGDFSPAELKVAQEHQVRPISLGESRLRTETAALAACFEINYINRNK